MRALLLTHKHCASDPAKVTEAQAIAKGSHSSAQQIKGLNLLLSSGQQPGPKRKREEEPSPKIPVAHRCVPPHPQDRSS